MELLFLGHLVVSLIGVVIACVIIAGAGYAYTGRHGYAVSWGRFWALTVLAALGVLLHLLLLSGAAALNEWWRWEWSAVVLALIATVALLVLAGYTNARMQQWYARRAVPRYPY